MLDKAKIRLIWLIFIAITIVIAVFLYRWQVLDYDYYNSLAAGRSKYEEVIGTRGKILSSDNAVLAYTVPSFDIYVYKLELFDAEKNNKQTRDEFATKIATILNIDKQELLKQIETNPSNYFRIAEKTDLKIKDQITSIKRDNNPSKSIEGYIIEQSSKRVYPDSSFASHVIGYIGKDSEGKDKAFNGIEGFWNGEMEPQEGTALVEKDSYGNVIVGGKYEKLEKKDGRDIVLTINRGLQNILEKKIKEGHELYETVYSTGIIMDPKTGAILAMAQYPNYDPNEYYKINDIGVLNNRSVSESYEPGSVIKGLTVASGIDSGKVKPDDIIIQSHNGCIEISDERDNGKKWKICTAAKKAAPRPKNATQVLETSDNIGAYYIAKTTGIDDFQKYLSKFGIGKPLDVGLAEESTGQLKSANKWNDIDLATYSFGQGLTLTPLQLTDAYATLANGGKRMKPYVVSSVINGEETIPVQPKLIEEVITADSAQTVTDMLASTFKYNVGLTKYKNQFKEYKIAGKSGTAQIPKTNAVGYEIDKVNTTYIGYDANPDSKFVMLIKLHKPKEADYSSFNVFPLWIETFLEIKDLLGVQKVSS